MDHLFTRLSPPDVSLRGGRILLCLDFDGTLAPIVPRPSDAVLSSQMRGVLDRIGREPWCTLSIISGRALEDLIGRVGLEDVIYGGNHGMQLKGPGIDFRAPLSERERGALRKVVARLGCLPAAIDGVLLEDKAESASIHFRSADEARVPEIEDAVGHAIGPFVNTRDPAGGNGLLRASRGKMVIDIRPASWNKGNAVQWLLDRLSASPGDDPLLPICMGDDATDEDAFETLKGRGITAVVGRASSSKARYWLEGPGEVFEFLTRLLLIRER